MFVAAGGLLAGCARYHSQPLSPAQTAARLEARSLDAPGLKHFLELNLHHDLRDWPVKRWDFNTLAFVAYYYHPSLDVARAQWRVSQAEIITAGGRPNPTVSAMPGYSFNAPSGTIPWLPLGTLDIPIETAGKRGHRVTRAKQLSEAARWNIISTAWQVRSNLRRSLLDYSTARRQISLLEQQEASQTQALQLLNQRVAAGALARSEVLPAQIQLAKTRQDLLLTRGRASEARVRLAAALGLPAARLDGFDFEAGDTAVASAASLTGDDARQRALQNRPDILSALSEYAASQSALQLEIARQYPDVHLGNAYQWDQGQHKWQIGLTAEIPVLNQNQGPIAEAQARRTESAARFTALQAKVMSEIDAALAAYRLASDQLKASEALLSTQQQQAQAVETQLNAGAADRLDLLNSRVELGLIELSREESRAKVLESLAALEDALQQPLHSMDSLIPVDAPNKTVKKEKRP